MLVRSVGEAALYDASTALYGLGNLGVREKGEYKEYFLYEFFYKDGALQIFAGALESAEAYLTQVFDAPLVRVPQRDWPITLKLHSIFGKGDPPTTNKQGLEVLHDPEKKGSVSEYYTLRGGLGQVLPAITTTASIISKISGLVSGLKDKELAERREENSKVGLDRAKTQYIDPTTKIYQSLVNALAQRGVPVAEKATDAFYAGLQDRIGRPPAGYQRGYDVYSWHIKKFMLMMEDALAEVNLKALPQPVVPSTGPVVGPSDQLVAPSESAGPVPAPAAAQKEGAGKWLLPAGAALVALKFLGG